MQGGVDPVPVRDEHQAVLAGGHIESGHDVGGPVGHPPTQVKRRRRAEKFRTGVGVPSLEEL